MVCHIGCWIEGTLWRWRGEVAGRLDPPARWRRPRSLTQWFVPDEPAGNDGYLHADGWPGGPGQRDRRTCGDITEQADWVVLQEAVPWSEPPMRFLPGVQRIGDGRLRDPRPRSSFPHRPSHGEFSRLPASGEFIEGGLLLATGHDISMARYPTTTTQKSTSSWPRPAISWRIAMDACR